MRRPGVDPEDGLAELLALWDAPTAEDLHRVLVLHPPVRECADSYQPFWLLNKHHEAEPETSVVTAMLLLTDRRWRGAIGPLARRIAASGIIAADELDLLARSFLAADDAVYWAVPNSWFDGGAEFTIDFGPGASSVDADELPAEDDDETEDGPTVARREVAPPLRRWAAERLLRQDSAMWVGVLARADDVNARSAASIMLGVLDAVEVLPAPVRNLLIARAIRWPDKAVRRHGYELLAEADGAQAVYKIAKDDPNAQLRGWAEKLVQAPRLRATETSPDESAQLAVIERPKPPTLF